MNSQGGFMNSQVIVLKCIPVGLTGGKCSEWVKSHIITQSM